MFNSPLFTILTVWLLPQIIGSVDTYVFETDSHNEAQAGLKSSVLLSQPPVYTGGPSQEGLLEIRDRPSWAVQGHLGNQSSKRAEVLCVPSARVKSTGAVSEDMLMFFVLWLPIPLDRALEKQVPKILSGSDAMWATFALSPPHTHKQYPPSSPCGIPGVCRAPREPEIPWKVPL